MKERTKSVLMIVMAAFAMLIYGGALWGIQWLEGVWYYYWFAYLIEAAGALLTGLLILLAIRTGRNKHWTRMSLCIAAAAVIFAYFNCSGYRSFWYFGKENFLTGWPLLCFLAAKLPAKKLPFWLHALLYQVFAVAATWFFWEYEFSVWTADVAAEACMYLTAVVLFLLCRHQTKKLKKAEIIAFLAVTAAVIVFWLTHQERLQFIYWSMKEDPALRDSEGQLVNWWAYRMGVLDALAEGRLDYALPHYIDQYIKNCPLIWIWMVGAEWVAVTVPVILVLLSVGLVARAKRLWEVSPFPAVMAAVWILRLAMGLVTNLLAIYCTEVSLPLAVGVDILPLILAVCLPMAKKQVGEPQMRTEE